MSAITVTAEKPPVWRRLIGFNLLTGIILGIIGYLIGYWIGGRINTVSTAYYSAEAGQNDISIFLGYGFGVVGFLIGLGFGNYPLRRLLGHPPTLAEHESADEGLGRYFRLCTDHKVVAMQYMVGIGFFFAIGGLNAMLIRTELLQPEHPRVRRQPVPDAGRPARLDDDGDDDLVDPRAVRQLARAADDRLAADGVSADRGVHVLAADGGRRGPDHDDLLRRLPDRLDRLRAARRAGHRRLRRLHWLLRAGRGVDDAARVQPAGDDHHDARARDDVDATADLRLGRGVDRDPDALGLANAGRVAVHGRVRPHRADRVLHPGQRRQQLPVGRTCSGCSGTPRCTSSRCRASGSCSSCCRCSAGSRCGVTGSRSPACSE